MRSAAEQQKILPIIPVIYQEEDCSPAQAFDLAQVLTR
jgi:hypothetical protein